MRSILILILSLALTAATSAASATPQVSADRAIYFVSDRDGNREIYAIQPDGSGLRPIAPHPGRDQAPAVSADGSRLAFLSDRDGTTAVWIHELTDGRTHKLADMPEADFGFSWSPDGTQLAWNRQRPDDRTHDLGVIYVESGAFRLITDTPGLEELTPTWSRNGMALIAVEDGTDGPVLREYPLDGSAARTISGQLPNRATFPVFSPDGGSVAMRVWGNESWDLVRLDLATGAVEELAASPAQDWGSAWSSDGRSLVFASDRDGNMNLYLRDPSSGQERRLTSHEGRDWSPTW